MLYPAVFLDRDGVICRTFVRNGKPFAPTCLKEFKLMPNSFHSVTLLKQAGFKVIVITNQPDIGNGFVTLETVESMHRKLREKLMVDDIFLCAHRQDEGCECRKPKPGMFIDASEKHGIDLKKSFMVGDRTSDVEAGNRAGCGTILLNKEGLTDKNSTLDFIASDWPEILSFILKNDLANANMQSVCLGKTGKGLNK